MVWGVVWDLALADVPALDRYESLSTGLYTKAMQPVLTAQGPRRAMVYVGRSARPGAPKSGYMEAVVDAAAHADLPAPYVRELETWLPHPRPSSEPVERPAVRPIFSAPAASAGPPADRAHRANHTGYYRVGEAGSCPRRERNRDPGDTMTEHTAASTEFIRARRI